MPDLASYPEDVTPPTFEKNVNISPTSSIPLNSYSPLFIELYWFLYLRG